MGERGTTGGWVGWGAEDCLGGRVATMAVGSAAVAVGGAAVAVGGTSVAVGVGVTVDKSRNGSTSSVAPTEATGAGVWVMKTSAGSVGAGEPGGAEAHAATSKARIQSMSFTRGIIARTRRR